MPLTLLAAALLLQPAQAPGTAQAGVVTALRAPAVQPQAPLRRKVLLVTLGQSNMGLTPEPDATDPSADLSDARVKELSQGVLRQTYSVADAGRTHVFQHPAQDDLGGICLRLSGAKTLLHRYPMIEEIVVYCGARGSISIAPGGELDANGVVTQEALNWCGSFMATNPDFQVVFWCSVGSTDAALGMPVDTYTQQLISLSDKLRRHIPGARDAFWVQGDMPSELVDLIDQLHPGLGTAYLQAQNSVAQYINNSAAATMFDLTPYDQRHLDAAGLRTFGARMGLATRL